MCASPTETRDQVSIILLVRTYYLFGGMNATVTMRKSHDFKPTNRQQRTMQASAWKRPFGHRHPYQRLLRPYQEQELQIDIRSSTLSSSTFSFCFVLAWLV